MALDKNILAEEGMKFFGKMSASATHEIKNALSIINENAGLLGDLSMMSGKGKDISPDRMNNIAGKIEKNVKRADLVLQKINRLSHSVDLETQVIDLEDTISFVLDAASRLTEQQGVVIEIKSPVSPVLLDTNLFFLENMIWKGIETACTRVGGTKMVRILFGDDSSIPLIWFSTDHFSDNLQNNMEDNSMDELFRSEEDIALIEYLGISVEKDIKNNSFGFMWPKRI